MYASKTKSVNGFFILEFYWYGDAIVYVNNRLVTSNFDDTVATAERGGDFSWAVS